MPAEVETLNQIAQLERFVAAEAGGDAAARAKALEEARLASHVNREQIPRTGSEKALNLAVMAQ